MRRSVARPPAPPVGALVEVHHLGVRYGRTIALDAVDLTIDARCFLGLVGPSGAGKTTLLCTVLGLTRPTSGRITRRPDLRIGYVPQVDSVDWSFPLSVHECVLLAEAGRRDLPWSRPHERRRIDAMLDRLGLGGLGDRHIRDLSGGQQQRVFLARALVTDPHLLVLDEPTSGIDVHSRHEVLHLLADLAAEGTAVVVATHDLNGVAAHLPRLVALNRRVVAEGTPNEVLTPDALEATYGAPFEVLAHAGIPVVLDPGLGRPGHRHDRVGRR